MDGYDSHFKIVRSDSADIKEQQIVTKLRSAMVSVLEADVITVTDEMGAAANELLIGRTNRPESVKAYDELTSYRANNGSDFIIRMDSGKLVIAANTDYSLQLAVNYFLENTVIPIKPNYLQILITATDRSLKISQSAIGA